ncbi:hypothetical protein DL96DRAFT_911705 [Flagelloscypha sp. PMI_526]|nr:hypothetical protein DL96DRAFT_911705 [Flagelloscypha sp. PMI_526]
MMAVNDGARPGVIFMSTKPETYNIGLDMTSLSDSLTQTTISTSSMQTKKSHPSLPPEIWEHTALYLSEREIANASCLSPALAYIAEGNKYQALSIPLHFQDRQPSKGTIEKKAEAELIKLKKEKHSHHVQALYLSSAPLSTTEHIRVQLGSLFRRTESMEPILLDDFIGIKELHLDTLDDHLSTTLPFVDMDRHPFALLVWSHVWTGLVHLSITANSNLGRICQMLPSSTFTQIPLPRLEVMKLKMDTVFWNQENTVGNYEAYISFLPRGPRPCDALICVSWPLTVRSYLCFYHLNRRNCFLVWKHLVSKRPIRKSKNICAGYPSSRHSSLHIRAH